MTTVIRKGRCQLATWLERREARYVVLRVICLSSLIAPADKRTPEERLTESLTEVRTRYVDGRLTEREFEEELSRLLEVEQKM
ncbi:hypothetical protein [Haloarchaeobius amylolyticus]|uniref:hypothetical protein n=1 Tax=Haloarchaeobius amylolyticus TaxID=1198296 RepID=UPI00226F7BAA|nr:hypothetical protein [Haloarchaeobius amylolyticus]